MLLAIDCGNTNIVFAVFDDAGELRGDWRSSTKGARTADELSVWLTQVLAGADINKSDIDAVIIATVVPATLFELQTLARKTFGVAPMTVGDKGVDLGVAIKVDRPDQVGADRLVNTVAAFDRHGGPLIVIDFGTATTFDVIDATGAYAGGVIAPGINLSAEALHMTAAQLPRVAVQVTDQVIGTDTVSAMKSGIFWGYVSMIEGMVKRIAQEIGGNPRVVATGGLAPLFAEHTDCIDQSESDLTVHGLKLIHQRNA